MNKEINAKGQAEERKADRCGRRDKSRRMGNGDDDIHRSKTSAAVVASPANLLGRVALDGSLAWSKLGVGDAMLFHAGANWRH